MSTRVSICPKCLNEFEGDAKVCPNDGAALVYTEPGDETRIGRTIDDKLTIVGRLGAGGMGAVYRAVQHSMEREVALKLLHRRFSKDKTIVKRFLKEARAASGLSHPNVITLFDFGQTSDGELYIIMELLTGLTLGDLLKVERRLSPVRAVAIIAQVCDALHAAHEAKIVHRDLKPDNIFIIKGAGQHGEFVKVLDFGIAKMVATESDETPLTLTGSVCGTPRYMSPEQAAGKRVDRRADLYAAGIVLYEMLAGRTPFRGDTPAALLMAQLRDTPPALSEVHPDVQVPADLEAVMMKALAKDPDQRPKTALVLKEQLNRAMATFANTGELTELQNVDTMEGVPTPVPAEEEDPQEELAETMLARPIGSEPDTFIVGGETEVQSAVTPSSKNTDPLGVEEDTTQDVLDRFGKRRLPMFVALAIGLVVAGFVLVKFLPEKKPAEAKKERAAATKPQPTVDAGVAPVSPADVVSPPAVPDAAVETKPMLEVKDVPPKASEKDTDDGLARPPEDVPPPIALPAGMVEIVTKPKGATVIAGSKVYGKAPVFVPRPDEGEKLKLTIKRAGYRPKTITVTHTSGKKLSVKLRKKGGGGGRAVPDVVR